jgi:lipocalin-like protein
MPVFLRCAGIAFALGTSVCVGAKGRESRGDNPLVGSWQVERYVDRPDSGVPLYPLGTAPIGLFVFTSDGYVSVNIMRNPRAGATNTLDLNTDPTRCWPDWYCSYFGTYTYDAPSSSWTIHVLGGSILGYIGTDQRRSFRIQGNRLILAGSYEGDGRTFYAERVLRRVGR